MKYIIVVVVKNTSSTIGSLAGVGFIPAGGHIQLMMNFFSIVPGLNFDMCMTSTRTKTSLEIALDIGHLSG